MHINLHKTFATPHGGGGPGAGPVCVAKDLEPLLPLPIVERTDSGYFRLKTHEPRSIGRVRGFAGQVGVLIRAYCYIRSLGADGLRRVAESAVLNARYLMARCPPELSRPYDGQAMHEFVLSAAGLKKDHGVRALDVAKRLLDFGCHPPTVYFPLIVEEALMIEPTETERQKMLDFFADTLRRIVQEARDDPELLHEAPHTTPVSRPDEVRAARELNLRYTWPDEPLAGGDADNGG
jgi:glycine dehydrogenase subunit 2